MDFVSLFFTHADTFVQRSLLWTAELFSLATGDTHPHARRHALPLGTAHEVELSLLVRLGSGIQVFGDYFSVHVGIRRGSRTLNKLIIYNWRTGELRLVSSTLFILSYSLFESADPCFPEPRDRPRIWRSSKSDRPIFVSRA